MRPRKMPKVTGHQNAQGQIIVTSIDCECGSPITHTTSSGMHCSNPDCNLEEISDNMEADARAMFQDHMNNGVTSDPNDPFGLESFVKKFDNIQKKIENGDYDK